MKPMKLISISHVKQLHIPQEFEEKYIKWNALNSKRINPEELPIGQWILNTVRGEFMGPVREFKDVDIAFYDNGDFEIRYTETKPDYCAVLPTDKKKSPHSYILSIG